MTLDRQLAAADEAIINTESAIRVMQTALEDHRQRRADLIAAIEAEGPPASIDEAVRRRILNYTETERRTCE